MTYIEYHKTAKYTMVAIISLMMLFTAFAGINIVPAKAEVLFTLIATETQNPYYGYYGGYHAIWAAIKNDLAQIGINVELRQYSDFDWWDRTASSGGWNKSWAEGGWDMYIQEWWLQPHALEPWFTSMVRSDLTPYEDGYNSHPWRNEKADTLLEAGMTSFNAEERKYYLWKWQEEFMRDPPWINLYYPKVYEVMGRYLTGYDSTGCWFYETQYFKTPSYMPLVNTLGH